MADIEGRFRPGRPWNDHARGYELAIQDALRKWREELRETLGDDIDEEANLGTKELRLMASLTARNPVDIDEYIVVIPND